ncbi:MAG: phosphoenolpyruvate--protein phosphotransferase, partial [Acidimicrobiia bacterium]|nr:phosphoenolpyruvate--protein phosphotransferase [Acidimicrobiia bacterium]
MVTSQILGRAAAPGTAVGPVFLIEEVSVEKTEAGTPEQEKQQLREALDSAVARLETLAASVGDDLADQVEIFEAQSMFIQDPELVESAEGHIDAGGTATSAISDALDELGAALSALEDDYLSARAGDIADIKQLVVGILSGAEDQIPDHPSILVATDVTPTQTVSIPRERILGIVCSRGSELSHAAILARTLGIPAVVAATGITEQVETGMTVAVDGDEGMVEVAPGAEAFAVYEARGLAAEKERERLSQLVDLPAETKDGRRVTLAANINTPDAINEAIEAGAHGSGLVRTEFLFQDRQQPPSADEQADAYR